jgi:hypothetical protein
VKYAIEGLVLLANTALWRIHNEVETTRIRTRVTGPISDILIALMGLKEVMYEHKRMVSYIETFIDTVTKRKNEFVNNDNSLGAEYLLSEWGSIFQVIEEDSLRMLGYLKE